MNRKGAFIIVSESFFDVKIYNGLLLLLISSKKPE